RDCAGAIPEWNRPCSASSYAEQGLHGRVRHELARMEYGAGERGRDQSGIREGLVDLRVGRGCSAPAGADSTGVGEPAGGSPPGSPGQGEGSPASYRSDATNGAARVGSGRLGAWVTGGHSATFRAFVPEGA